MLNVERSTVVQGAQRPATLIVGIAVLVLFAWVVVLKLLIASAPHGRRRTMMTKAKNANWLWLCHQAIQARNVGIADTNVAVADFLDQAQTSFDDRKADVMVLVSLFGAIPMMNPGVKRAKGMTGTMSHFGG